MWEDTQGHTIYGYDFCMPWFSSSENQAPVTDGIFFDSCLWPGSCSGYATDPRK